MDDCKGLSLDTLMALIWPYSKNLVCSPASSISSTFFFMCCFLCCIFLDSLLCFSVYVSMASSHDNNPAESQNNLTPPLTVNFLKKKDNELTQT